MTTHNDYNLGPVSLFLGHGVVCNKKPPATIGLGAFNLVAFSSKHENKEFLLILGDHKKMLGELLQWTKTCHYSPDDEVVVAMNFKTIHKNTGIKYMQHVSERFMLPMDDKDILQGGFKLTINSTPYDIRSFEDGTALMHLPKKLMPAYLEKVKTFQNEYMGYKSDNSMAYCWEIRERIISYPYGLYIDSDPRVLPPKDEYLELSYKFK